jgi:hypothetical protein
MKSARPEDEALNANEQKTPPENGKGAANPGAAASAPAAAPGTDRPAIPTPAGQTATFRYVDRPELVETFADSITGMFFDGQSLRIEFAVSRVDEIKARPDHGPALSGMPPGLASGRRHGAHQPHAADRGCDGESRTAEIARGTKNIACCTNVIRGNPLFLVAGDANLR